MNKQTASEEIADMLPSMEIGRKEAWLFKAAGCLLAAFSASLLEANSHQSGPAHEFAQ
jgi:hypothetical protein